MNRKTIIKNYRLKETTSRFSPMILYSEATDTIIDPMRKTTRTSDLINLRMNPMDEMLSSRFENPLSLGQSLLVVFPHTTALIAITLICFAISYLVFMIQEIRSWYGWEILESQFGNSLVPFDLLPP